jgi:hypothetical protein
VAERQGVALMPELGMKPVNRYLPPRPARAGEADGAPQYLEPIVPAEPERGILHWIDRILSR